MRALDLSFDAPKVTPAWAAARIAEGWELLWVDAWVGNLSPAHVERALRTWREAGGLTGAYYVPHAFRPAEYHLERAMAAIGAEWQYLRFLAIDVEEVSEDPAPRSWTVPHIRQSADLIRLHGQRPALYTREGYWLELGNPTALSDLPLIDAHYDVEPNLDVDYGGWTRAVGHQYRNSHDLAGVTVDANLFDEEWVRPISAGELVRSVIGDLRKAEEGQLHRRWGDAQALRQHADALHEEAGRIEAEVVADKVRLGLQ